METRNKRRAITPIRQINSKMRKLGGEEYMMGKKNTNKSRSSSKILSKIKSSGKRIINDSSDETISEENGNFSSGDENLSNGGYSSKNLNVSNKLSKMSAKMENFKSRNKCHIEEENEKDEEEIKNFNKVRNLRQSKSSKSRSKSKSKFISKSKSKYMEVDEELDDKVIINYLPCREREQDIIYNYIKKGLDTSGCYTGLYISGMPGTGKTACVTTVINKLRREAKKRTSEIDPFNVLEINGMKITNPNNVYKYIYEYIFTDGRGQSVKKCTTILDNFFRNKMDFDYKTQLRDYSNPHLILVIDEIDCLINQKQMLLYNIFNWTTYPHSKLIIISISNTLDLPEKLLPKISSRMGNNRLSFKPYQKDELVKILSVKIENFELFSDDAIKLSSMKVAAVSGDLRRILKICKRAKEIFDDEHSYAAPQTSKIEKKHILKAIEDLYDAKVQKVIRDLQFYEKLVLAGILFEMKLQMNNRVSVSQVFDRFKFFYVKAKSISCKITFDEYMIMIYNLAKMHIITFSENFNSNFVNNSVIIKFYPDEFTTAVEKDDVFEGILKELA